MGDRGTTAVPVTLHLAAELFGVGAVAGGVGTLLGVGGGFILVPGLVFVSGLPFAQAVGTSLTCVVATSVAGSAIQFGRGQVDVSGAVALQFYAVLGAVLAGLAAPFVPTVGLYFAFALVLVIAALRTWPRAAVDAAPAGAPAPAPAAAGPAGAFGGGAISGLLGVGGGIIFTPLLHLVLRHDFRRAAAVSVYLIGVTAGSGALVYLARGDVLPALAAPALLGVVTGASLGSSLSHRFDDRWLKRAFALLLLYVSARMVLQGLRGV